MIPWTDLVSAIAPNGRTLANARHAAGRGHRARSASSRRSFANAIFAAAQFATGPGQPVGEPFVPGPADGLPGAAGHRSRGRRRSAGSRAPTPASPTTTTSARAIVEHAERYHSAYYIDPSHAPPPLFVGSGLHRRPVPGRRGAAIREPHAGATTRARRISLLLGDFGHQRASNKPRDRERLLRRRSTPGSTTTCAATGARPRRRRDRDRADLPANRAVGRAVHARRLRRARARRGAVLAARPQTHRSRAAATRGSARRSTRRPAAATAASITSADPAPGTAAYSLPPRDRRGLHAARRAARVTAKLAVSGTRRTARPDRGPAVGRRAGRRPPDARRARPLPARPAPGTDVFAAAPERLALRARPQRQARAARLRRALRPAVERALLHRRPRARAATAGARGLGGWDLRAASRARPARACETSAASAWATPAAGSCAVSPRRPGTATAAATSTA